MNLPELPPVRSSTLSSSQECRMADHNNIRHNRVSRTPFRFDVIHAQPARESSNRRRARRTILLSTAPDEHRVLLRKKYPGFSLRCAPGALGEVRKRGACRVADKNDPSLNRSRSKTSSSALEEAHARMATKAARVGRCTAPSQSPLSPNWRITLPYRSTSVRSTSANFSGDPPMDS